MNRRNGLDSLLAFVAALGNTSFIPRGLRRSEHHSRSAEEVAWLRQRAAAKRGRRLDRNRWNREMELCSGRGRYDFHWPYRFAISSGVLKPKRRHGHAAH